MISRRSRWLCVLVVALVGLSGCTSGNPPAPTSMSLGDALRAQHAVASREVITLQRLRGEPPGAVVLAVGRVVDVSADRAWRSLPDAEIRDGIDAEEIHPFDSPAASFRSMCVRLEIEHVLVRGRDAFAAGPGDSICVTLLLPSATSFDVARDELVSFDDVVVPLAEVRRGALGDVVEVFSGADVIIDVAADGTLSLPLSDKATSDHVLGGTTRLEDLMAQHGSG